MAYMTQEKKKSIEPQIKALAKKYGVKCTLAVRNYSKIVLNIKSGVLDFIDNYYNLKESDTRQEHLSVMTYHINEYFSGQCKEFLAQANNILHSMDYFNNADVMTDYFHVAYYVEINIGTWSKPYLFVPS